MCVFVAIASFGQWQKVAVRNKDAAFVSEFLNDSMAILTRVAQEEQSVHQNRAAFSLQPKKVNNVSSVVNLNCAHIKLFLYSRVITF